jgi:hemolysin III
MRLQSSFEEKLNALTHGIGAVLGLIGLVLLIAFDTHKTTNSLFSVVVYGSSVLLLFTASTLYHSVTDDKRKYYFRILDHISIYFLIAGTYTPVLVIILFDSLGWILLYIVWGIVAFGVVLKLFFTGKYEVFSSLLYLAMGWLIVFDFSELSNKINEGTLFLIAGGVSYTIGILFYAIKRIPYNHVIWHLFVLMGALCHFLMIFYYVI